MISGHDIIQVRPDAALASGMSQSAAKRCDSILTVNNVAYSGIRGLNEIAS